MADASLRLAVWQSLLDAARFERYYGIRAETHRRHHRVLRFILLFVAVGGMARLLDVLPPTIVGPVAEVASIAIVGIVIWDFMADDGKKAAILHAISIECGEFELRLRSLWMSLNSGEDVDESAIRQELYAIEDGLLRVTARPGHADIAEHDRDNKRAAEDAYQNISDRFAPEGGGDD